MPLQPQHRERLRTGWADVAPGPSRCYGRGIRCSRDCLVESARSGLALADRAISPAAHLVEESMLTYGFLRMEGWSCGSR